eukprot:CAMPEP_0170651990 /NCGR_PEP_ID=MMETSP0224-20130122/46663_1 /TAXON_ID=285029 /ORGANISM="Togula jolla, Strain CCCM 725" /LENGTH=76 /DNA_ID=CAMNT_0010983821 /DNA_START=761 /DNA_END=988 /DNA_ORIENTATION=-
MTGQRHVLVLQEDLNSLQRSLRSPHYDGRSASGTHRTEDVLPGPHHSCAGALPAPEAQGSGLSPFNACAETHPRRA